MGVPVGPQWRLVQGHPPRDNHSSPFLFVIGPQQAVGKLWRPGPSRSAASSRLTTKLRVVFTFLSDWGKNQKKNNT